MRDVSPFVARILDLTRRGPIYWSLLKVFELDLRTGSVPSEGGNRFAAEGEEFSVSDRGDHHPDRFARGDLNLTASRGGKVVASTWLTTAELWAWEVRAHFVIQPGEIVRFDSHVDPACRRQGLNSRLASFANQLARQRGFQRLLTYVDSLNLPSLRVQKKTGMQLAAKILCIAVGNAAWHINLDPRAAARFRK